MARASTLRLGLGLTVLAVVLALVLQDLLLVVFVVLLGVLLAVERGDIIVDRIANYEDVVEVLVAVEVLVEQHRRAVGAM